MHMELTEQYLKIVQKAAAKANYLYKVHGSWKKVAEDVGGVSHNTWTRIANGTPTISPRIETLRIIAAVGSVPKKYDVSKDMKELKRTCCYTLRLLAEQHGHDRLAEMLRVEPNKLSRWLAPSKADIPEFRYLLAIDSLVISLLN